MERVSLFKILSDDKWRFRQLKFQRLREYGDLSRDAIPALVALLSHPDVVVRQSAVWALCAALSDLDSAVRMKAASALGTIGPQAIEAIPDLILSLADDFISVASEAAEALCKIGTPVVIPLVVALENPNENLYRFGTSVLGRIAVPEELIVFALGRAFARPGEFERQYAAFALAKIGDSALPTLIAALDNPDEKLRQKAVEALGTIRFSELVVPALNAALADRDQNVRLCAVRALCRIGFSTKLVVPALIRALAHPDESVRFGAVEALASFGVPVVPSLIAAIGNPVINVRQYAIMALGQIYDPEKRSASVLINALADSDMEVRRSAIEALTKIHSLDENAIPAVIGATSEFDDRLYFKATEILVNIGPASVPLLIAGLTNPACGIREFSVRTLAEFGSSASVAVPYLALAFNCTDDLLRWHVLFALQKIGDKSDIAVRTFIAALAESHFGFWKTAIEALKRIGKSAVPALNDARHHPDINVRRRVVEVLIQIAPHILANEPDSPEPKGIERMPQAEVFSVIDRLRMFRRIGEICLTRGTDSFSFNAMADEIAIGRPTIRRHMQDVSNFFRKYFERFERLKVPKDDDETTGPRIKFVHRRQGKRPTIGAMGWIAWEETCRYLDTKDSIQKA